MGEFKTLIFGNFSFVWYIASFFFASLGLFIRWRFMAKQGVKNNPNSPEHFSWEYWFEHNLWPKLLSVLTTIVIVFLCLRFAGDWFGVVPTMAFAVVLGLAFDWFVDFVKKLSQKGLNK